jgi:hypothetical protein
MVISGGWAAWMSQAEADNISALNKTLTDLGGCKSANAV